ncbi:hypothetical protein L345_17455, partial [Ophiophagus hannah]
PEASQPFYYEPRAPPAEVETSSYVLLTYLTRRPALPDTASADRAPTPSQDDLAVATKIVSWLIKQQNPFGGFSSTQVGASHPCVRYVGSWERFGLGEERLSVREVQRAPTPGGCSIRTDCQHNSQHMCWDQGPQGIRHCSKRQLTNATLHFSFTVERSIEIQNQRPAFAKVYDYYDDESAVVAYSAPCST